jgi:hypothetical protein
VPWLITTTGWPTLALHLATTTAHVTAGPVVAVGAAAGAVACVGAVAWRTRGRQRGADLWPDGGQPSGS